MELKPIISQPPAPTEPLQAQAHVVYLPVPQGLPTVNVVINGISVSVSAPQLGEAVVATENILIRIRAVLELGGYAYI
jgi:hypothetical protein